MKIALFSSIALSASAATSSTSSANIPADEKIYILSTGALGVLPTDVGARRHRELAAGGGYCSGVPICSILFASDPCDQDTTCPSYMNKCQASCSGLCGCKSYSLGCSGGYSSAFSCMYSIVCQQVYSTCAVLTDTVDCSNMPGCLWSTGSPGSAGSSGTPSSCYDDYDAIWESTQLQYAAGDAMEGCEEKFAEESGYVVTCPEANQSFESACTSQGGALRYNDFSHECGGYDVTYHNFPWCMSPSCSKEEQRNVNQILEDGLITNIEKETGLQCIDKPNPASSSTSSLGITITQIGLTFAASGIIGLVV